jgi:hypothetical protein
MDAVGERSEALPRDRECVGVAVDADEGQSGMTLQHRLGVPAHAEGAVDDDSAVARERRGEQLERPLEEHGGVDRIIDHEGPCVRESRGLIPIR